MYTIPTDIYISLICRIFTVFSCIISILIYFRDMIDLLILFFFVLLVQQQQQNDSDILCLFFVHILILDILI